ncbi:MAG TPA: MoaD/ThiS family protein [Candidatus Polarisedimenticolia bacterium]|nr:MoaD/ThiS family protein [Candidatus Polarisedimenticolia bacterium]
MRVTVKLFASYRELAGAAETSLEIPDGSTVQEAWGELCRIWPALAAQPYRPLTACNLRHVPAGHRLREGDELALLPPVSGG